ncbi:MAG: 16S rRNA (uracil(1498)-N(3))-methyltransferase [Candidatus Nitrotoga sp.]
MSIPRFYCPPTLFPGTIFNAPDQIAGSVELPATAAHHASRVLRLRVNDEVYIFDGAGNELHGRICAIAGKSVRLDRLHSYAINRESPLHIVLAQALCSSEKMDWIVQKATELGVSAIQPLQTERSITRLSDERAEKRAEHWRRVTIAACEQCSRNTLPIVYPPQDFTRWLVAMRPSTATKLMLAPTSRNSLSKQVKPAHSIALLIGPEGGWSAAEMEMSKQANFIPISFGARILRTETAAIAGITALQTLWGDLG